MKSAIIEGLEVAVIIFFGLLGAAAAFAVVVLVLWLIGIGTAL